MDALLATIALWLSVNFGFPADVGQPRIEFEPASKIIALRYRGLANTQGQAGAASSSASDTVSIYDDANKTIYLPEGWKGRTPAELSILVLEMVHHLQNSQQQNFDCPQAREMTAYEAQGRWLTLFGRDL